MGVLQPRITTPFTRSRDLGVWTSSENPALAKHLQLPNKLQHATCNRTAEVHQPTHSPANIHITSHPTLPRQDPAPQPATSNPRSTKRTTQHQRDTQTVSHTHIPPSSNPSTSPGNLNRRTSSATVPANPPFFFFLAAMYTCDMLPHALGSSHAQHPAQRLGEQLGLLEVRWEHSTTESRAAHVSNTYAVKE